MREPPETGGRSAISSCVVTLSVSSAGLPLTHMRQEGTNAAKSSPYRAQASVIASPTLFASTSKEFVPAISRMEAKSRNVATYKDYRQNS